jgi:hypothetical protein
MGGVCIFAHKSLTFDIVTVRELCKDKAMEACAVKCKFFSTMFCITAIYRSPSSNFQLFIT